MKTYRLNENGVCVNPDVIQVYSDLYFKIFVKYAFYNGSWAYGIDIWYNNELGFGGMSFSPSFAKKSHISFAECERSAYNSIVSYFSEWEEIEKPSIAVYKAIDNFFFSIHLDLFYSWAIGKAFQKKLAYFK